MKIKIYVIARISEDAHLWTDKICDQLDHRFAIFKPKDHNPWNKRHETFAKNVYDIDVKAIRNSHIGLLLPEYGKDCAWECGWYAHASKPVVAFVDTQMEWLRDWMVKGGIDYVVTNNASTFRILKKDPILRHKEVIFIKTLRSLNKALIDIYHNNYAVEKNKK